MEVISPHHGPCKVTVRGTVWLLGDRFAGPEVRQHLPAWWGQLE